jgi:hypothetical protein
MPVANTGVCSEKMDAITVCWLMLTAATSALIDDIHYNRILGEKKHTGTSL